MPVISVYYEYTQAFSARGIHVFVMCQVNVVIKMCNRGRSRNMDWGRGIQPFPSPIPPFPFLPLEAVSSPSQNQIWYILSFKWWQQF